MMPVWLGRRFTIRTSRAGEPSWIELSCRLLAADAFTAQTCRVAKEESAEHGTEIIVSDLRGDEWTSLAHQPKKIRDQLGDCYSYLLSEGKLAITLNG